MFTTQTKHILIKTLAIIAAALLIDIAVQHIYAHSLSFAKAAAAIPIIAAIQITLARTVGINTKTTILILAATLITGLGDTINNVGPDMLISADLIHTPKTIENLIAYHQNLFDSAWYIVLLPISLYLGWKEQLHPLIIFAAFQNLIGAPLDTIASNGFIYLEDGKPPTGHPIPWTLVQIRDNILLCLILGAIGYLAHLAWTAITKPETDQAPA